MRNLRDALLNFKALFRLLMLAAVLSTVAALTPISTATPTELSISLVNNSGREIRHLYLSSANDDNWGADQLNELSIGPGATRMLNVSWDQAMVKLVGEDEDGCFLSVTVEATGNPIWTITSDTARNCGG